MKITNFIIFNSLFPPQIIPIGLNRLGSSFSMVIPSFSQRDSSCVHGSTCYTQVNGPQGPQASLVIVSNCNLFYLFTSLQSTLPGSATITYFCLWNRKCGKCFPSGKWIVDVPFPLCFPAGVSILCWVSQGQITYSASDLFALSARNILFFLFLSFIKEIAEMEEVRCRSKSSARSSSSANFSSSLSTLNTKKKQLNTTYAREKLHGYFPLCN